MSVTKEWIVRDYQRSLEKDLVLPDGTRFNYVQFYDGLIQVAFQLPNGDMITFAVQTAEEYLTILDLIIEGFPAATLFKEVGMYQPVEVLEPELVI